MELLLFLFCIAACAGLMWLLLRTTPRPTDAVTYPVPGSLPQAPVGSPAPDNSHARNSDGRHEDKEWRHQRRQVFAVGALALATLMFCVEPLLAFVAAYAGLVALVREPQATGRPRVFRRWVLALSAVWLLLNMPRSLGGIKWVLGMWAGFPWTFAAWGGGGLREFDPLALAGDIVVGALVVIGLAGLCTWSRTPEAAHPTSRAHGEPSPVLDSNTSSLRYSDAPT